MSGEKRLFLTKYIKYSSVIAAALLLISILTGCERNAGPISKTGFYFDTVIQITLYDTDDTAYLDGCLALADTYENRFSAAKENSDIWKINHSGGAPVSVSSDTTKLLQTALYYAELTDGKIDPTILPLSELWGFHAIRETSGAQSQTQTLPSPEEEQHVPSKDAIQEALAHVDYHALTVDADTNTVTLSDPQAAIDVGFIAKGYIADRMKDYLVENGVRSACINLGGNVLTIGAKPDGSPFRIGVQKPFAEEGQSAAVISISDRSVVSSGIYERYFYEDDILYHHILDTATGYPCDNELAGVTILSASSVEGDALSTTCYLLGLDDGITLIESLADVEALFITRDGALYSTSGFPKVE